MKKYLLLLALCAACSSAPKQQTNSNSRDEVYDSIDQDTGASVDNSYQPAAKQQTEEERSVSKSELKEALEKSDFKKVEDIAAIMLSKNPKDVHALNALAIKHLKTNKPTMARFILNKALSYQPDNAGLINNIALTYLAEKEETKAILEFKKALNVDSKNTAVCSNFGAIHLKARNYTEAVRLLEHSYSKNKTNPKLSANFATALRGLGDYPASRRVFEDMGIMSQKDAGMLLNYAILLVENMKDKTKGQEVLNRIKFLGSDPVILEKAKQLEAQLK